MEREVQKENFMEENNKEIKEKKEEKRNINIIFNIIAIVCIALIAFAIVERTLQNDTYYTITLGKQVLDNGIDMQEHYSYHEGLQYTYPHWLYDIGIYLVYSIAGFNGVYISSIILSIVLGLSIYFTSSKISKNNLVAFILTILVLYFGRSFITARAQLVTFILFVLEIYCIEQFLNTKKKRYVAGLIVIPIAIANIHAAVFPVYFVFYLPYIAEYLISTIYQEDILNRCFLKIDKVKLKKLLKRNDVKKQESISKIEKRIHINEERMKDRKEHMEEKLDEFAKIRMIRNQNTKWLILIMIICIFTGLATPIGDTPYTYLYHTMQGNTTENISEHLPIVLYNNKPAFISIALIVFIIAFNKVKIRLSDLFLLGGLIFLTIMSRRQFSLLLFIGVIVFSRIISDVLNIYDKDGCIEMTKYMTTIVGQVITYALMGIIVILLIKDTFKNPIVNEKSYPVAACDFILENLDVNQLRIYNDYNYGSYLMFRGIPVFIDSRADVYDPKFNGLEDDIFSDYISLTNLNCDYEQKFTHYGINYVMTYKNAKLNYGLSKDQNYKQIYADNTFIIYERLSAS